MSEVIGTLTPEIRGAKAAERPAGHQVATGANPNAKPVLARQAANRTGDLGGSQSDFAVPGSSGPAQRGAANHFGWKPQAAMEISSYAETIAVRTVAPGALLSIDPSMATIWRILAAGSLVLEIDALPSGQVGMEPVSRVLSLVLYIQRNAGAEITWPPGTMFGLDVLDPNGDGDREDSLLNPPETTRTDVFVLNLVPTIGWVGYVAAIGLAVA